MKRKLSFSICMPVYKGSHVLKNALNSIFRQKVNFDFEVIVGDDNPKELEEEIKRTKTIIASFKDKRMRYCKNKNNLGSALNIKKLAASAKKEILFFLCQDDVLAKDALQRVHDAFLMDDDIGVVTRPFYCFMKDIHNPVRVIKPYDKNRDRILSVFDGKEVFCKIFETVGQISGLAFRRKYIEIPFSDECFTGHIYPFAGILRKYKCVFLKDYIVVVGVYDSQTRHVSTIYNFSPVYSWIKMYKNVFHEEKYRIIRLWGIDHIATHFVGLVQLKNYGEKGVLMKEIAVMVKNRPKNLLNPKFWFYVFFTLLAPRSLSRYFADFYKANINSRFISNIRFNY